MQNPREYYEKRLTELTKEKDRLSKLLVRFSIIRLLAFLSLIAATYFLYGQLLPLIVAIVVFGGIFVFLILHYNRLQQQKRKHLLLIDINQTELLVIQGNFEHLPAGDEYADSEHHFSHDIDLFGEGSFFQYSNRTALKEGEELLARWLKSNHHQQIHLKQEAVKELRDMPDWRQEYSATARMVKSELSPEQLSKWFREYQPFLKKGFKTICLGFGLLSLTLITAYLMDLLSGWTLLLWFFTGLGISGFYLKRVNTLAATSSKALETFQHFHKLILLLETSSFSAELLMDKQQIYKEQGEPVSALVRRFADILHAFDQRNNMLVAILGNGLFLWDLYQTYRIEQWIQQYGEKVKAWFDVLYYFDACNSQGNFAFNHPSYAFPEVAPGNTLIEAREAGHPLLTAESRITNDFQIREGEFHIITGANMAGKSTFLRTISLLIVMANTGLPVCAEYMAYTPIKLVTSMRTADSLTRHESYFFSELKRLKFIVDEIIKERYFIVLDEILKGTNSTDKAQGSRQFLERLVASGSTGLIATHDLSLCEASDQHIELSNYFFDAQIKEGELFFDYRLKPGICQNMNASFLLKKMNIVP